MISWFERRWPRAQLSLRWKVLIALSLLLITINVTLAVIANLQSVHQLELQQSRVRDQQTRQLRAMLKERGQEMSKLASMVPLLGPESADSLTERLRQALDTNGAVLDLEWDIRSVHWITADGRIAIAWPQTTAGIPSELRTAVQTSPEQMASVLACRPACGQYVAIPLLYRGVFAGNLVLERSLSDAMLAFNALTGAEIAIDVTDSTNRRARLDPKRLEYLAFPVLTYPEQSLPVLHAAGVSLLETTISSKPALVHLEDGWFEIFCIAGLADGVDAYVINDITRQRLAIQAATRKSLLIGIAGVILSELLLLMIMQAPLRRLKALAQALPLLAEKRYGDLRAALTQFGPGRFPHDEIDLMIETVGGLTDRMELLQQDREQAEQQLLWLADNDPLTRLTNRRRFNEDFARIADQAARYGHQGALLYMDLDDFKDVNDLSGHQVGDSLLQRVAEALRTISQPSDLLARLGGDEFALVLPEASLAIATTTAESAQRVIRAITLRANNREHRISASIGIATFPVLGQKIPDLLANADLAMYQAKGRGHGGWHLFCPQDSVRAELDARILWKEQIADALREDRFVLHFQPVIDLRSGRRCHVEALLRMPDAQGGLIRPNRFIPIAEKTRQIQAIDQWVLARALEILAQHEELNLAINLSANAMDDPTILTNLKRLLLAHAIDPSRLSFEITETVAISSLTSATRLMLSIRKLGCRFALDDFGSGYASYAYLRQLPVDDLKIDGAFIRDLPNKPEDRIFVKAFTDMAHGMNMRVIAEFVETVEVLEILKELGVDCAQGYLFSKPLSLEEL